MKKIRILSIDGGGIRGIIPAVILAHIEKKLQEKSGNPNAALADHFDLIAGTSTGGILACMYVLPQMPKEGFSDGEKEFYTAAKAVEFYEKYGKEIFKTKFLSFARQLSEAKYSEKGLEKILNEKMQEVKLSDTRGRCLITAYDTSNRKAIFFTSKEAKQDPTFRDYYMKDIARATSAAPTYFKPANIGSLAGNLSCMIDGGVFANNPSMCAYVEVKKELLLAKKNPIEHVYILSIGTGKVLKKYPYNEVKGWGLLSWAAPVVNILMSSSAEVVDFQLRQMYKSARYEDSYFRIEPNLGEANSDMDDASDANIKKLKIAALNYISDNLTDLDKVVDDIIKYGTE